MDAKTYLRQIDRLNMIVDNKMLELEQLEVLASGMSTSGSGDRVQTSVKYDRVENAVIKIMEKKTEVEKAVEKYLDKKSKIIEQLEGMEDDRYYNILFLHFVKGLSFEEISKETTYELSWVYRLYKKGLAAFYNKYCDEFYD